jgi:dTDP-4-dehydrorhamnose reductase
MRVLITGASGMLGKDISLQYLNTKDITVYGIFRNADPDLERYPIIPVNMDLTDLTRLRQVLKELKPDLIIHCAAMVNVDGCEKNREYAHTLHSEASKVLALNSGSRFVYISSDSVFDGKEGNYVETAIPYPLNYYAQTKLEGEKSALSCNPESLVIRTNIYGFHFKKSLSLAEWAIENLAQHRKIGGFNDVCFNPLYTKQLAQIVESLAQLNYTGIIHAGSGTAISKYNFLLRLAGLFGYSAELIEEKSVDTVSFHAPRPKNTTLDISLLKKTLLYCPSLTEGLNMLHRDYCLTHPLNS